MESTSMRRAEGSLDVSTRRSTEQVLCGTAVRTTEMHGHEFVGTSFNINPPLCNVVMLYTSSINMVRLGVAHPLSRGDEKMTRPS